MTGYRQDAAHRQTNDLKPREGGELIAAMSRELEPFAAGWDPCRGGTKLQDRLDDIVRFWRFNSEEVISKSDRDEIARLANALLEKLTGLGGLDRAFLDTLRDLAFGSIARSGKGGDRRSGERTLQSNIMGMAVRVYLEACERPTISKGGKLFRFANLVGELVMGQRNPFKGNAVEKEARRMKEKLRRRPNLTILYQRDS